MDKVRVLIDTDLGDDVDDAAAFMLALSCGVIEIAGVTTVFKDTRKRAWMVRDLLSLYGRSDIPICAGYGHPIMEYGEGAFEEPIQFGLVKKHTGDGRDPSDSQLTEAGSAIHAEDFIIQKVKEDKELVILAMGAMTNLAMAFLKEPKLMGEARIIGMGGSFMNSSPEWNILCDPEAASPQDYKVGLMIPGNLGDKSFFDASFRSIEPIKEQLGVDVDYVEAGVDTSKYYPALVDMCEKGYDLILTISSNNDDALVQVAKEYPDQKFINLDDEMAEPPANVYIMGTKNNEMSFLAGAAGALKAAGLGEDKIGFVGGMDIPGINEFLVGYIEGAQAVNPDIKVAASYVGSFTDTAKGKENALLLYNSGLSVIFAAAGQSGLGVIDAAVAQGKFVIGVDSDQAEALKDSKPEMAGVVITSAIKNIPENAVKAVDRAMKGEIPYGTREVFGIAEDAVGIAENEFYEKLLSEEDRKQVEELKQKVVAGEVQMTPTTGITTDKVNEIREAVRP